METTEKSIDVLNDLIKLNNDRVAGFEKAAKDLGDGDYDLKTIFEKFATDSRSNAAELKTEVAKSGGDPETGSGVEQFTNRRDVAKFGLQRPDQQQSNSDGK